MMLLRMLSIVLIVFVSTACVEQTATIHVEAAFATVRSGSGSISSSGFDGSYGKGRIATRTVSVDCRSDVSNPTKKRNYSSVRCHRKLSLSMSKREGDSGDGEEVKVNIRDANVDNVDADADVDLTTTTIRKILDWMKNSKLIEEQHAAHRTSTMATHLFKGTPLVDLPAEWKLRFVHSKAGRMVETIMEEEQSYLGDWKVEQILDAAGRYDSQDIQARIENEIEASTVVVFSFADCPWCVAAKELLWSTENPYYSYAKSYNNNNNNNDTIPIRIVELEDLGPVGKHVRAELAKATGRTSMPCIFVNKIPIGGFTSGAPIGPGLRALHESGQLLQMMTEE